MSEQDPNKKATGSQDQEQDQDDVVSLDAATYTALLERLDYLEQVAEGKKGKGGDEDDGDDDDVDALAARGKRRSGKSGDDEGNPPDFDSLSQTELVQHLERGMVGNYIQPLMQKIYQIDFQLQIDRLTKKEEFKDFHDYDDEIYKVLKDNPNMKLEDAYYLAKKRQPEPKEGDKGPSRDALRHLPRPKRPAPGEKPGHTSSMSRSDDRAMTTKQAAAAAYDEVFQKE
jgi:hypothetical protein